jgi:hypothetical protein
LFVAALIAAISGAPRDFYIAGGSYSTLREWAWDSPTWRGDAAMLEATAARYGESIAKNKKILDEVTETMQCALRVAGVSPLIGLVAFIGLKSLF